VVAGLVPPRQAVGVLSETVDPLVLLVGMMSLGAVAEKAGFFDWSASLAVRPLSRPRSRQTTLLQQGR
jgi:Na+/H+ antiporter NhaD/arsenite permease-like protein